ncbi:MAG TPA: hypothetical protein VID28_02810 [Methylomirabilota bacterium]|jgi:hypothetical protein
MAATDASGRKSPEEFVEQMKELVAANIAGNAQLLTRLTAFLQEAAKSAGSGAREPLNGAALLSRWFDFNLASFSVVSSHSLAMMAGLLTAAEAALLPRGSSGVAARPGSPTRIELRLDGRPGDRLTSAFMVENHFDHPLEVSLESSNLVPASGPALPASLLSFEPATLSIGPRAQAVVQVVVTLTRHFAVGQTYLTVIRLVGLHAREVGLSIAVHPPASSDDSRPAEAAR